MPKPKYSSLIIIAGLFTLILLPGLISQSYGSFGNNALHWQMVYVNDNGWCLPNDLQNIQQYSLLVESYFELYQFEAFNYEPNCMSLEQFSSYRTPYDFDLLILFFDQNLIHHTLGDKGLSGLYAHTGNDRSTNHFILLNDRASHESDNDSKNPSWILSNSLSHFILFYKGYDEAVIEKIIQPDVPFYRNCFGTGQPSSTCLVVRDSLRPPRRWQIFCYNSSI